MEAARDDEVRRRARRIVVALPLMYVRRDVRGEIVVHERRARCERALQVDDRVERVIIDAHVLRRVFCDVPALRDHDRDRLADMAHLVAREERVRTRMEDVLAHRRWRNQQRAMLPERAQVLRGVHGDDAGSPARLRNVDPPDTRVRQRAAHERDVQHARQLHVVDEQRVAGEQPRILVASDGLSEVAGAQARSAPTATAPAPRSAASATASTMFW